MKSDKDIWKESLNSEDNIDLFKTEPGGEHAKPLPFKEIFKTKNTKELEERVDTLEKQVKQLLIELKKLKPQTRWEDI